ncbi:RNA-binding protein 45-like [Ostrinia furnacalis]|uniref:RNA-binding protein 45-like n=1 Tax=Ostrinia furnacalis TaxID=93504 RepID=UPI00103B0CD1|nr:RNA-binding protein 45-like [Ostrinia furnacalis]
MYNNYSNRSEDRKEEKPPYSRIFVVCGKQTREEDLQQSFEQFGTIEDLHIPRDRNSGEPKGVAYIKFTKTSSAAAAIQELHLKPLRANQKPVKVMIALNRSDPGTNNEERYKRLFIKVHKDISESEIIDHFSKFGRVNSVHLQKDKATGVCKGFAYVHYSNFYDAAKAYEECDSKYKPVFATPKDELKRMRPSLDMSSMPHNESSLGSNYSMNDSFNDNLLKDSLNLTTNSLLCNYNTIIATCSPQVSQKSIERLFNIVPGMQQCQYTADTYNGICKAVVTYDSEKAAAYALERINNYEFPSGEIVTIKPDDNPLNKVASNLANIVNSFKNSLDAGNPNLLQLADAIAQTSSLIKAATTGKIDQKVHTSESETYGNVCLPPPQPTVGTMHRVAQRCFIVCKPYPPSLSVLRDIFCRFGDLIDVCTFPNKTFGFVKYASIRAAQEAMRTLNGKVLHGVHYKVLEADERPSKDEDAKLDDPEYLEPSQGSKRIKLHQSD